jgi:hypothetical protein
LARDDQVHREPQAGIVPTGTRCVVLHDPAPLDALRATQLLRFIASL